MKKENLLTITATEYSKMVRKPLSSYKAQTVSEEHLETYLSDAVDKLVERLPKNTEAVVNYKIQECGRTPSGTYGRYLLYGTALIPKKAYSRKHK